MADIERLLRIEAELKKTHPGYGPTLRSQMAVERSGVTNPQDVKRLGKRIREELELRKKQGPTPPPIPFA